MPTKLCPYENALCVTCIPTLNTVYHKSQKMTINKRKCLEEKNVSSQKDNLSVNNSQKTKEKINCLSWDSNNIVVHYIPPSSSSLTRPETSSKCNSCPPPVNSNKISLSSTTSVSTTPSSSETNPTTSSPPSSTKPSSSETNPNTSSPPSSTTPSSSETNPTTSLPPSSSETNPTTSSTPSCTTPSSSETNPTTSSNVPEEIVSKPHALPTKPITRSEQKSQTSLPINANNSCSIRTSSTLPSPCIASNSSSSQTLDKTFPQDKVQVVENPLNIESVELPYTSKTCKRHFCQFCKTLQTKFSRHLFLKHKSEDQVKRAMKLPIKSQERCKIIEALRKEGDFIHNSSQELNTGILIVSRNQQKKFKNTVYDYVCCKQCRGFFSKKSLRIHVKKCSNYTKFDRSNMISGRKLMQYVHAVASDVLKTEIFPVLRDDHVTKAIRYDELIIKFGNKLAEKYTLKHQHDRIRAQLRYLGRFKNEVNLLDAEVTEFKHIFQPHLFGKCITALRKIANWDNNLMKYRTPAVVTSLTSLIKKCGKMQRAQFIESQSEVEKQKMDDFLLLWADIHTLSNNTVTEDQPNVEEQSNSEDHSNIGEQSYLEDQSNIEDQSSIGKQSSSETNPTTSSHVPEEIVSKTPALPTKPITRSEQKSQTSLPINANNSCSIRTSSTLPSPCIASNSSSSQTLDKTFPQDKVQVVENPLNIESVELPYTSKKCKRHFCQFCKTLQTKFSRHLFLKHKSEDQVKRAMKLPIKSQERCKIIEALRKEGDFIHNSSQELNTGILIVSRNQQKKFKNTVYDYACCKQCRGFFSKKSLRIHVKKCSNYTKFDRSNMISGRKLMQYVHAVASDVLKTEIFPVLRDDHVTKAIRYDELIIKFGNKLAEKYTLKHQHDMIRAQLRYLGRFKNEVNLLDAEVTEFKHIFQPHLFANCVTALHKVANWDNNLMQYRTPAVVTSLTSLIMKCGKIQRAQFIESQSEVEKQKLDDFLLLWSDIHTLNNKTVTEDQPNVEEQSSTENQSNIGDQSRQEKTKEVVSPSIHDIKLLYTLLKGKLVTAISVLEKSFNIYTWTELVKASFIFIQICNRRQAGEIKKFSIQNCAHKERITDNMEQEMIKNISQESMSSANQFVRISLIDKLGQTVSVLLSPLYIKALDLIIKHRKNAGITEENFIFPKQKISTQSKQYDEACPLLIQYASECGAQIPEGLNGTTLRNHIARYISLLNAEEASVDRLANFMGHKEDTHTKNPIPAAEITFVFKLLLAAIGIGNDDDEVDADEENNNNQSLEEDDEVVEVEAEEDLETRCSSNRKRTKSDQSIPGEPIQRPRRQVVPPRRFADYDRCQDVTISGATMKRRGCYTKYNNPAIT